MQPCNQRMLAQFDKPGKVETAERPKQVHGYDSSEKRRVPSFTDRIFFRGTKPMPRPGATAFEEVCSQQMLKRTHRLSSNNKMYMVNHGQTSMVKPPWSNIMVKQYKPQQTQHTHSIHNTQTVKTHTQYTQHIQSTHTHNAIAQESVDLLGLHEPEVPRGLGPVVVTCEQYDSLMDVLDSDHKPVFVVLRVEMNTWDTVRCPLPG